MVHTEKQLHFPLDQCSPAPDFASSRDFENGVIHFLWSQHLSQLCLNYQQDFWQSRERKWVCIFEIPLESGGVGWVKVTHQGCWLSDFHCLTHRLTKWHSIILQHRHQIWFDVNPDYCVAPLRGSHAERTDAFSSSSPFLPPPLFQLHMLQGDGRQRGWLQFTPDILGTIRNHLLPICLIAAIAYRSYLLSVSPLSEPNDRSLIDLPFLGITKRTVQQPSRCASQLQLSISCWWRGDSLSLFKDPIHSDFLKVLMLILLSLQASGNGG